MGKKIRLGRSISIQGTNDYEVPNEIRSFYKGHAIPVSFLQDYYGFGKSLSIGPRKGDIEA